MDSILRFYLLGKKEIFEWWDSAEKTVRQRAECDLGRALSDFLYLDIWKAFGTLQTAGSLQELHKELEGMLHTHPFLAALDVSAGDYDTVIGGLTEQIFALTELQGKITEFMDECLSAKSTEKEPSIQARYLSFITRTGGFSPQYPQTEEILVPETGHAYASLAEKLAAAQTSGGLAAEQAKKLHAAAVQAVYPRSAADCAEYLARRMLADGIQFKTCKYCGKFFAVLGSANADYCTRQNQSGKTCRDIGAVRLYQNKKAEDPISRLYVKAYKKYFAWIKYGKFTKEEFSAWSERARAKRDACMAGKISPEDFRQWLNVKAE